MSAETKRCESCGVPADVELHDESLWCWSCHGSALALGYDTDTGSVLVEETS